MSEPIIASHISLAGILLGGLISYFIARNAKEGKAIISKVKTIPN